MRKPLLFLIFFLSFVFTAQAAAINTDNWYSYNGYSDLHNFSIKFPTDWKAITLSDDLQGFAPKTNQDSEPLFFIQEFEGQTYNQVIKYFENDGFSLLTLEDDIFSTTNGDLISKRATYSNITTNQSLIITLIKRGSLIVAVGFNDAENLTYGAILETIQNSFNFNDSWKQYFDPTKKYSFIYPNKLSLQTSANRIELLTTDKTPATVFTLQIASVQDLSDAPTTVQNSDEDYLSSDAINFHGYNQVLEAEYKNLSSDKKLVKILVKIGTNLFSLSGANISTDFPRSEYYNQYIPEILESFEVFDVAFSQDYSPYRNFPDIKDSHPNSTAINTLVDQKIINGYADGTFKPDGLINRAELTKMIVATIGKPNPKTYKNCFPDVQTEWFAPYICYAKSKGWVEGYADGNFKPETNINRVEAIKIVLEALFSKQLTDEALKDKTVLDISANQWYTSYFAFADNRDFLDKQHISEENGGKYRYFPSENITRKEVAELIYRSRK